MTWVAAVGLLLLYADLPGLFGAPRLEVHGLQCLDWQGLPVEDGIKYIPKKDDPCMVCMCEDGFPVMCTAVLCSPPDCRQWEAIEGECCRFNCIEPDHPQDRLNKTGVIPPEDVENDGVDTANLGLRLVASTVTSFLILALLLFMVHRLRQRRMLIMMRRMHNQRDEDTVAYMSQFDQVDVGIEFPPYEEPPPPYTPPKPPDIPHGEAPPPYEATHGQNNSRETNNNEQGTTQPGTGGWGPRPTQGSSSIPNGRVQLCEVIRTLSTLSPSEELPITQEILNTQAQSPLTQSPTSSPSLEETHEPGETPPGGSLEDHLDGLQQYENRGRVERRQTLSENELTDGFHHVSESDPEDTPVVPVSGCKVQAAPSPALVMVRMHNNSPQSHLVRNPCDVMSRSAGSSSGGESTPGLSRTSDRRLNDLNDDRWLPSGRTSFIKRSDSVEIKRGSSSPRNSFYLDDLSLGDGVPEGARGCGIGGDNGHNLTPMSGSSGSPHSDFASRSRHKPEPPNVTWNKSCRPFRIRLDCDSGVCYESAEPRVTIAGQPNPDPRVLRHSPPRSQPRPIKRHSTLVGMIEPGSPSPSPPSSFQEKHRFRHSMPPVDLDLPSDPVDAILGASDLVYPQDDNSASPSNDPSSPDDVRPEVGVSPSGSGRVTSESSSGGSPAYSQPDPGSETAPSLSSPSVESPQSPVVPAMVRSGSIASQLSQFSVCSETGERKRPKPSLGFPRPIRNDLRYPHTPFTSNYAAPMSNTPPVFKTTASKECKYRMPPKTSSQDSTSPESHSPSLPSPRTSGHASPASNNNSTPSSTNSEPTRRRNKICYVERSPDREKTGSESTVSSPSSAGSASSGYPNIVSPSSPAVSASTPTSSLSPTTPDDEPHVPTSEACKIPKRSDSTTSRRSQTDPLPCITTPDRAERHTVRKVKKQNQKKRHSRGKSDPQRNLCNGEVGRLDDDGEGPDTDPISHSPERYRHMVRPLDTSATYKQYGFIDDPDVINNARDCGATNTQSGSSNSKDDKLKRRNSKEKQRDNSKERKHESSRERHDNSRERKRESSRDRQRDYAHERRDNSSERRRNNRDKGHRGRSHERCNGVVDAEREACHRDRSNSGDRHHQNRRTNQQAQTTDRHLCNSQTVQGNNRMTTSEMDNTDGLTETPRNEGRKRVRDYGSQAASMERRKKRRSTGERLVPELSENQPSVSLNNGHILQPMDCNCNNGPLSPDCAQNEADLSHFHDNGTTKRTKNSRTMESRRSMPIIAHKNR